MNPLRARARGRGGRTEAELGLGGLLGLFDAIAFGFDMLHRKPQKAMICWNDPVTGSWDWEWVPPKKDRDYVVGLQGYILLNGIDHVDPEFIFETDDNRIVAYQPGVAVEMVFVNVPHIWQFNLLHPVGSVLGFSIRSDLSLLPSEQD